MLIPTHTEVSSTDTFHFLATCAVIMLRNHHGWVDIYYCITDLAHLSGCAVPQDSRGASRAARKREDQLQNTYPNCLTHIKEGDPPRQHLAEPALSVGKGRSCPRTHLTHSLPTSKSHPQLPCKDPSTALDSRTKGGTLPVGFPFASPT